MSLLTSGRVAETLAKLHREAEAADAPFIREVLGRLEASGASMEQTAAQMIADSLEAIRTKVVDLKRQRDEVLATRVSKDIAFARVDEFVRDLGRRARQYAPKAESFIGPGTRRGFEGQIVDVLALYMGDVLAKNMKIEVAKLYQTTNGLDDAARAARLAEIDRELLATELEEEAAIRSAERIGLKIPRRADADPRAVLAHDEVLP